MAALAHLTVEPEPTPAKPEGFAALTAELPGAIDIRAFVSVSDRAGAEAMLMLDRQGRADAEWSAFFVESMIGYLVWQAEPWGVIAEADLDWLLGMVADAPTPSTPALLYALVREVNGAPERLISLAMKHGRGRLATAH